MDKKMIIHRDIYISIGMLVFCAAVYITGMPIPGEAAVLPKALVVFMAAMSFVVFFNGWKMSKAATAANSPVEYDMGIENLPIPMIVYAMMLAYLLLFQWLGYFAATILFIVAVLRYLRAGSWKMTILITAGYIIVAYVVFVTILNIPIYRIGILGPLLRF